MIKPKFILTDIEGTTTPKTFVYDVLFPYFIQNIEKIQFRKHLKPYAEGLQLTKNTILEESKTQISVSLDFILDTLKIWVKNDRKHPGLKLLQGLIWEDGYNSGELKGIIYDDVLVQLENWFENGIALGVYSSGSIRAQKLLFSHTNQGNICAFFQSFFDTTIGGKKEASSYTKISIDVGVNPNEILFLSDMEDELEAAKQAGMSTIQLARDQSTIPSAKHMICTNFSEIKWK